MWNFFKYNANSIWNEMLILWFWLIQKMLRMCGFKIAIQMFIDAFVRCESKKSIPSKVTWPAKWKLLQPLQVRLYFSYNKTHPVSKWIIFRIKFSSFHRNIIKDKIHLKPMTMYCIQLKLIWNSFNKFGFNTVVLWYASNILIIIHNNRIPSVE